MSNDYLYVDENLNIYTGEDARGRVSGTNDAQFLEGEKGILRVPMSRWGTAQQYEKKTWMEQCAHAVDDRNQEHCAEFDGYRSIAGRRFPRAIELGCGPFTNLRVLGRYVEIERCVLLDPLVDTYLQHRHCSYRHGKVTTAPSALHRRLSSALALRAVRRLVRSVAPEFLEAGIPVERRFAVPIEEMQDCGTFDLVVMINVLEHCFDVERIFANVLKLCRPGTVFVFHDRLYDPAEVQRHAVTRFDAGHPLRIAGPLVIEFLEKNFTILVQRFVDVTDQVRGINLTERGLYCICVRR